MKFKKGLLSDLACENDASDRGFEMVQDFMITVNEWGTVRMKMIFKDLKFGKYYQVYYDRATDDKLLFDEADEVTKNTRTVTIISWEKI